MIRSHAEVKAWSERHGLSLRMASAVISGVNGQALVAHGGTIAALARRGLAEKSNRHKYMWCLSAEGKDLLAEIECV